MQKLLESFHSKTDSKAGSECLLLTIFREYNGVVKRMSPGANVPHFESQSCQLLAMCDFEQVF